MQVPRWRSLRGLSEGAGGEYLYDMTATPLHSAILLLGGLLLLACLGSDIAAAAKAPAVDELPAMAQLPDPFLLKDGSRVKTPQEWATRREELKELLATYEYGHLPPASAVSAQVVSSRRIETSGEPKPNWHFMSGRLFRWL